MIKVGDMVKILDIGEPAKCLSVKDGIAEVAVYGQTFRLPLSIIEPLCAE